MRKDEPRGAQLLREKSVGGGIRRRFRTCVLRVAEDREAGGHAVQPELMCAARQGMQLQKRRFFRPFQYAVVRQRLLSPLVHHADETAAADLIDRQVDLPFILRRLAEDGGKIGFFQLPFAQHPAEPVVDIRVFC